MKSQKKFFLFLRECELIFAIWGLLAATFVSLLNTGVHYSDEFQSLWIEFESNNSHMIEEQKDLLIKQIDYVDYSANFYYIAAHSSLILFLIISYVLTREWFFAFININSLVKTSKGHQIDQWLFGIFIFFYLKIVFSIVGLVLIDYLEFIPPGAIYWIINSSTVILVLILLVKGLKGEQNCEYKRTFHIYNHFKNK